MQKKILFRFYSGCYWIKENSKRINLCEYMKAVAPRQEGTLSLPGTCLDSFWKQWACLSIHHHSGQFSTAWSHLHFFSFLNINDNDDD